MEKVTNLLLLFLCVMGCSIVVSGQVAFNGKKAAIDSLTGTWILSVPRAVFGTDYQATVSFDDDVVMCEINNQRVISSFTFANVQPGAKYPIILVKGGDTVRAEIQFTHWPVIQIYGKYVKRPYARGTVIYTDPNSSVQETITSRVRWAGSSTAEPNRKKHNFHLKFYNADGSKKNMSFFGLRSDFHWRLDAGQIDFARVRNRVAKDIWADFASKPYYAKDEAKTPYNYVRGDFVEVFLNDQYMGIYSLNEHMDRQQLKLKQYDYQAGVFHGGLWKPMSWSATSMFKEASPVDRKKKNWESFYVKYPNIDDVLPTNYDPLYQAVYFTVNATDQVFRDSAKYYFDIPVFRDYYLFTILLQAPDNLAKNVYYACYDAANDHRLTLAIWDLDCTQGQYWSNLNDYYHHADVGPEYDFRRTKLMNHKAFRRLSETDLTFHGLATERYWSLRGNVFNPDSIVERYETYFNEMKSCGADQREIRRWSKTSDLGYNHELNFDTELDYLRDWWTRHINYLDNNIFIPFTMGDVNFDYQVDLRDIIDLIDSILCGESDKINEVRADMNGDKMISISDVCHIIDLILSSSDN